MKLVTRKQLIELPNGTVFHPIDEDGFLGAAQVKYTSLANDFTSMYLAGRLTTLRKRPG